MPQPIKLKVDVTKLDKSAFFRSEKTGAIYADLILWPAENSQYGDDYTVKQDLGKDRRGEKTPILGNGRFLQPSNGQRAAAPPPDDGEVRDPIPF